MKALGACRRSRANDKHLGYDFCRAAGDKNPFIAGPLKRPDCSLGKGGVTLSDLSFVETHDGFTIAKLIEYEAMGLA